MEELRASLRASATSVRELLRDSPQKVPIRLRAHLAAAFTQLEAALRSGGRAELEAAASAIDRLLYEINGPPTPLDRSSSSSGGRAR